jgi:hypothetical protein
MYDRDVLLLTTAQWYMYTDRFQDSRTLPIYKRTKALSPSTLLSQKNKTNVAKHVQTSITFLNVPSLYSIIYQYALLITEQNTLKVM